MFPDSFNIIILVYQLHQNLADLLTDVCVDAVLAIRQPDKPVDLHMIELMEMQHKTETDTQLVKGMYLSDSCFLYKIFPKIDGKEYTKNG